MKHIIYDIGEEYNNSKIRTILKKHFNMSASVLKVLKQTPGGIKINGIEVYATAVARTGDTLELSLVDKKSVNIHPVEMKLDILYEDEDVLVVNKPRNMPTHPSCNHHDDTLANGVMGYYNDRDFTFRVITRLDRDTSGIVLVAKNKLAASYLTTQMTNGDISKTYYAICHGKLEQETGIIDAPISRVEGSAIMREVSAAGKSAVTKYEVIDSYDALSFVKLSPLTGRTHQIRVHLSYMGNPIYGDDMYGSPLRGESIRLHCGGIEFISPNTKKMIKISAPIPEDMTSLM